MTYAETKALMMEVYPSLFVDEADVLHHLFIVNGNGYGWENGELTDGQTPEQVRAEAKASRDYGRRERVKIRAYLIERAEETRKLAEEIPSLATLLKSTEQQIADLSEESDDSEVEREREVQRRIRMFERAPEQSGWRRLLDGRFGRDLYPMCQYADILHIPEDVKPDWLDAAERMLALARSDLYRRTPEDNEWLDKAERIIERRRAAP